MQELMNFAVYPFYLERFDNDWTELTKYVHTHSLDGIELLIGYQPLPQEIPQDLIVGIHLPILISWMDIWQNNTNTSSITDPELLSWMCCGSSRDEMVANQEMVWQQAANLDPAYAVFHVCNVTIPESFTREFKTSDREIIQATTELLNAAASRFPNGEPPVRLFLENLWWPGLTLLDNSITEELAASLDFDNWAFVLDTAHLLNTQPDLRSEDEAVDYILEAHSRLSPEIKERIEGLHLNFGLTGKYQQETISQGLPDGWEDLDPWQQFETAKLHVNRIDPHLPFGYYRVREIVHAVQPQYLTHELAGLTHQEFDANLSTQRAAVHKPYSQ